MSDERCRGRTGATMLEVLLAVVILGTTVAAFAGWLAQTTYTARAVLDEETRVRRAARLLTDISLLPKERLEQRLGRRDEGAFLTDVAAEGSLFRVAILDTLSERILLETSLYRPQDGGSP